jgi:hypothetical protein
VSTGCVRTNLCTAGTLLLAYRIPTTVLGERMTVMLSVAGKLQTSADVSLASDRSGGTIEIDFPHGYPSGDTVGVTLLVFGTDPAHLAATGSGAVTLDPLCSTLTITVTDCALAEDATDFYTDANALPGGSGAMACPTQTVTESVAAARASTARDKIVHVAAGTYRAEPFPIVVRGGVTIVGASVSTTLIEGAGQPLGSNAKATIEIGDESPNGLAHLTLHPPASVDSPEAGFEMAGVVCSGGNLPPLASANDPRSFPSPNTLLEDLVIGPGYEVGLQVDQADEQQLGGCNLSLRDSTITGNYMGAQTLGCGATPFANALTLGDSTNPGHNRLLNHSNQIACAFSRSGLTCNNMGPAVLIMEQQCLPLVRIFGNDFESNDYGIRIGSASPHSRAATFFDIEGNQFIKLNHAALELTGASAVEIFSGNHIDGVTIPAAYASQPASGVSLLDTSVIYKARDNSIIDCDTGVRISNGAIVVGGAPDRSLIDFGRVDEWGHNVIACNSRPTNAGVSEASGDVRVEVSDGSSGGVSFAGNIWDHDPPTTYEVAGGTPPDGTDFIDLSPSPPLVDIRDSSRYPGKCKGRTP